MPARRADERTVRDARHVLRLASIEQESDAVRLSAGQPEHAGVHAVIAV